MTPNDSYTTLTDPAQDRSDPLNGITGLDRDYPYGSHIYTETPTTSYIDNDSPGLGLTGFTQNGQPTGIVASFAMFKSTFVDYLMYLPPVAASAARPDDVQWLALAQFNWSTSGSATIPATKSWADYVTQNGSDAAGAITPDTLDSFDAVYGPAFYPGWKHVNVSQPY